MNRSSLNTLIVPLAGLIAVPVLVFAVIRPRFAKVAVVTGAVTLPTTAPAPAQTQNPKGKTTAAIFAELLPAIGKPDVSAQQKWQELCFAAGAPGNEKLRAEVCELMAGKLDANTPKPARLWFLAQLARIGNDESIDAIAALLNEKDDEIHDAAVRALANNPSPKATTKLVEALGKSSGNAKVGVLNALGHRGDAAAVPALTKELGNEGEAAVAAARALGRVPGEDSAKSLAAARATAKGSLRRAVADAQLVHADRLLKLGKTSEAAAIYQELSSPEEAKPVRLAALRGRIQSSGDQAGNLVMEHLAGNDADTRAVAVGQIDGLSAAALKPLAANLDKLPVPSRVLVITAVASRGDRSQLPLILNAARSDVLEVKRAGVLALGRLGDSTAVELLLSLMFAKDPVAGVAVESLASLPAEGVNEKLIAALDAEKTSARSVVLIGILERRKAAAAVPALLKSAAGDDAAIRAAAFSGLKTLATPEHVPAMIAALLKTAKGKERENAETAITAVATQNPDAEKRAHPVLAAIKAADKSQAADLLPLLGRLGGSDSRKLIRESLASTDPGTHDAAVAGLLNWPDTTANDDLLVLAEKGTDAEKPRALQALVRVNTMLIERTPEERLASLEVMKKAMASAWRDEERRLILEGLGNVRHIDTLRYIVPFLDEPTLAQAACKGVVELAHSRMLREPNKAEFAKALDRVISLSKDKGLIERAKGYKTAP
jgi:HEAT repeat protein